MNNEFKYYSLSDECFKCPCCMIGNTDIEVIVMLNTACNIAGEIIPVESGSRCILHNSEVGGSDTSSHLFTDNHKSTALDLKAIDNGKRWTYVFALKDAGFKRIGIGKETLIHVDKDKHKLQERLWTY